MDPNAHEHVRVIDGPGVWMEGEALRQLERVASHPACVAAAGMPDLHPGPGTPIGASVALAGTLWPALLGGDLGCGVRLVSLKRVKARGDDLLRRMDEELAHFPLDDADPAQLLASVWARGPRGLLGIEGVPESLQAFAAEESEGPPVDVGPVPDAVFARQLGTVGGGNHFLELARVADVPDRGVAAEVGLKKGGYAVVAHSGSRGLGKHLAGRWGGVVLDEADAAPWLADVRGAVNYARTNRFVLCWRMLKAVGMARPGRVSGALDLGHNVVETQVVDGRAVWVHRKGSAPAHEGQLTVVLGSRGTPSWVMRGRGNEGCLCSVAHGAGRKLDRGKAVALMRHRYKRAELRHTALGGRVLCNDRDALYAEHPDCYKPVEPVIQALEAAGAATRVAALHPVLTVKR